MDMFDRMEHLAKERGWSKTEFLRRIGLNSCAIRDWRIGKASPNKHMGKIVRVLGTTEAYLRGETNNPHWGCQQDLDDLDWALLEASRSLTYEQKWAIVEMIKMIKK